MTIEELNQYEERRKNEKDKYCLKCAKTYHKTSLEKCLICHGPLINMDSNMPTCPTCHSTHLKRISDAKRVSHGIAFGFLSKTAFSQFECLNCGYKW